MRHINLLPKSVTSKLRSCVALIDVAQVADELVCNSLDAGATQIRVSVDSDNHYIKVEDDGCGISRDNLTLVGERHATSKLQSLEQLDYGLETLGFRGEALSSLSDIALVEITSRVQGSPHCYRKVMKDCATVSLGLCGQQRVPGTTVVARDMFYSQPVRRRLLFSSHRRIVQSVKERVIRLLLVHPEVSFTMVDAGRQEELLHTKCGSTLHSALHVLFGEELCCSLQELDFAKGPLRLTGYISKTFQCFPSKVLQFFYINRRFVNKTLIHRLLNSWASMSFSGGEAKSLIPKDKARKVDGASGRHRYSAFVLNLQCPISDYDITFEASKTYVEFKDWMPVVSFGRNVLLSVWGHPKSNFMKDSKETQEGKDFGRFSKPEKSKLSPFIDSTPGQSDGNSAQTTPVMCEGVAEDEIDFEMGYCSRQVTNLALQKQLRISSNKSPKPCSVSLDPSIFTIASEVPNVESVDAFDSPYMCLPRVENELLLSQPTGSDQLSVLSDPDWLCGSAQGDALRKTESCSPSFSAMHSPPSDKLGHQSGSCADSLRPLVIGKSSSPVTRFRSSCFGKKGPFQDFKHTGSPKYCQTKGLTSEKLTRPLEQHVESPDNSLSMPLWTEHDDSCNFVDHPVNLPQKRNGHMVDKENLSLRNYTENDGSSSPDEAIRRVRKKFWNSNLVACSLGESNDYSWNCFPDDQEESNVNVPFRCEQDTTQELDPDHCQLSNKLSCEKVNGKKHQNVLISSKLDSFSQVDSLQQNQIHRWNNSASMESGLKEGDATANFMKDSESHISPLCTKRRLSAPPFYKPSKKSGAHGNPISSLSTFAHTVDSVIGPREDVLVASAAVGNGEVVQMTLGTSSNYSHARNCKDNLETEIGGCNDIQQRKLATSARQIINLQSLTISPELEINKFRELKSHSNEQRLLQNGTVDAMYQAWSNPCMKIDGGDILDLSSGVLGSNCSTVLPESVTKEKLQRARVLQQVDMKFIAVVAGGVLLLIDQHAADERIRLEELRHDVLGPERKKKTTLLACTQELSVALEEQQMLHTYCRHINDWGWHFRAISVPKGRTNYRNVNSGGVSKVLLSTVPCILGVNLTSTDLIEYLHQLIDTDGSSAPPPAVVRVLNYKSCRGAIMFGDKLLPAECTQLVDHLKQTSLCFQCAHGRPTMVPLVDLQALYKQFSCSNPKGKKHTITEKWHGLDLSVQATVNRAQGRLQRIQPT